MIWASRMTDLSVKEIEHSSISIDSDRNVYVTGKSEDSDTSFSSATIKYSSDGSLLWLQRFCSSLGILGRHSILALDSEGQVYVSG